MGLKELLDEIATHKANHPSDECGDDNDLCLVPTDLLERLAKVLENAQVFNLNPDITTEDSGCAKIVELDGATEETFVRVHSWDETKAHREINTLLEGGMEAIIT